MWWSYKKQLKHLEVQVNEVINDIRKGVNKLMIREPGELTAILNNLTKKKDLEKYIGQLSQLEHELEQVKAIKASTGRSKIIYWLWNELELVKYQNKLLIEARKDNNTVAEQELVRQIIGGSSSDKITEAISYLDEFQKCIEKELDRLMESPHKSRCLPCCWY